MCERGGCGDGYRFAPVTPVTRFRIHLRVCVFGALDGCNHRVDLGHQRRHHAQLVRVHMPARLFSVLLDELQGFLKKAVELIFLLKQAVELISYRSCNTPECR